MDRNQTTGTDQRSAIGSAQAKYGFPKSQLDQVARNLDSFVLIGPNGQVWTSEPDAKSVHRLLDQTVQQFQPEGASG